MSSIDEAKQILKDLDERIKVSQELLKQQQDLMSEKILSGKSEAGIAPVVVDKETQLKERVNKLLANTGMKI